MPRPITHADIAHQQQDDYPISVADRSQRWVRIPEVEGSHDRPPDAGTPRVHGPARAG